MRLWPRSTSATANSMGTAGVAECVASPNLEFANLDYLHGSRTWLDRPAKEVSIRKGGEPLHSNMNSTKSMFRCGRDLQVQMSQPAVCAVV